MFQVQPMTRHLLAGVLCLVSGLPAQQTSQAPHTVRASADATVTARPDRAQISVSIYSQAATAEAASEQNARATSSVLTALKQVIGSKGQIRTSGFVASPQMHYPNNGGTPKITGYEATNHLTAILDEIELVSKAVDTAIDAGATRILDVNFSLKDDGSVRQQALAQASRKAYDAAQAIAKALNLSIVGVLEAQTGAQAPTPPVPMFRAAAQTAEVSTPIEPGEIDVQATVTVTLEVK
jgi:uncharacterized protein